MDVLPDSNGSNPPTAQIPLIPSDSNPLTPIPRTIKNLNPLYPSKKFGRRKRKIPAHFLHIPASAKSISPIPSALVKANAVARELPHLLALIPIATGDIRFPIACGTPHGFHHSTPPNPAKRESLIGEIHGQSIK